MKVSIAESLTGGLLANHFVAKSDASDYFVGGVIAYNLEQKVNLLKVNEEHAKSVNCVSVQVAKEMAKGVCDLFKSDYAISTTGFAEIDGYSYICFYNKELDAYKVEHIQNEYRYPRNAFRQYIAQMAYEMYLINK